MLLISLRSDRLRCRVALPEIPYASPTQALEALFRHGFVARAAALLGSKVRRGVVMIITMAQPIAQLKR